MDFPQIFQDLFESPPGWMTEFVCACPSRLLVDNDQL